MTNQILDTKAIEMLELTDTDLMAVNGGIAFLPLLIPAVKAAGTGAAGYGGKKAAEAVFG